MSMMHREGPISTCASAGACLLIALAIIEGISSEAAAAKEDEAADLKQLIKPLEPCVMQAVFSFSQPNLYPPTDSIQLAAACKRHQAAIRCIKDSSKGLPALMRRGFLGFATGRQRAMRKICTDLAGAQAAKFVRDYRCVLEKREPHYRQTEIIYGNTILEILRQNYNDSASELKQFCCATYRYRKGLIESDTSECSQAKETTRETMNTIVPSEISLICDDEDKLAKVCDKLEPLRVSSQLSTSSESIVTAGLYLVATLGEAEAAAKPSPPPPSS